MPNSQMIYILTRLTAPYDTVNFKPPNLLARHPHCKKPLRNANVFFILHPQFLFFRSCCIIFSLYVQKSEQKNRETDSAEVKEIRRTRRKLFLNIIFLLSVDTWVLFSKGYDAIK